MTTKLLLPHQFKTIGWIILIPATIAGLLISIGDYEAEWLNGRMFAFFHDQPLGSSTNFRVIETNLTNTITGLAFIVGAMMVGFSKEKIEDAYLESAVNSIRFKPALEKGKPVSGVAPLKFDQLLL